MIIKLYDIEDEIAVTGEVEASSIFDGEENLAFLAPVRYDVTVKKFGTDVRIKGSVKGTLSLMCDRCLEQFPYPVDSALEIELLPKEEMPQANELELQGDEMNLDYYEGDEIDLDPFICEEVVLNIPIKALCGEACKGICPVCGQNLNKEDCGCDKSRGSVLGEKLKLLSKRI
jgi:uncharacterized protein